MISVQKRYSLLPASLLFGTLFMFSINVGVSAVILYSGMVTSVRGVPRVSAVAEVKHVPTVLSSTRDKTSFVGVDVTSATLPVGFESPIAGVSGTPVESAFPTATPVLSDTVVSPVSLFSTELMVSPTPRAIRKPKPTRIAKKSSVLSASISANIFSPGHSASPSPTITIRVKASVIPTPSVRPTPHNTPLTSSVASAHVSTKSLTPVANSLSGDIIFDLVNKHRASIGKAAFQKNAELCTIASARAPQIYEELYKGKGLHTGFKALNLSYWATENIANYQSEQIMVNWWLSDSIHKKAIESDHTYSCAACSGKFCSQIFTSFVKK
jgi:uncharacterized protein YkwD